MSTQNEAGQSPAEQATAGEKPENRRLTGRLGTWDIVFTVLAFNAPLSVFVGFITVIIGYGNGLGAPVVFLVAGGLMLLFAVGFTAMSRFLPNPGAFYAYITAGLGKPLGLGSALLAIASYFFILVGGYAFGSLSIGALVHDVLGGPEITWWVYVLIVMTIVGVLGYFRITLSARILTVFMVCEVLVIIAYDIVVFITQGASPSGINLESFLPENIVSGSIGLAILFGIVCFSGFEATAIFREEAKDPARTIPRATYIAIIVMGGLYFVTALAMINGIGASEVVALSAADPTGTSFATVSVFLGRIGVDIVTVLLVTSIFAANLAAHNVTTRYLYSLSKDGVFAKFLSAVHVRHDSPNRSSVATSIIGAAFLMVLVFTGAQAAGLYAVLVGIGGYSLIILLVLTSVAVFLYFRSNRSLAASRWQRQIAPILATLGLLGAFILATQNVAVLIGGDQTLANVLIAFFFACLVGGSIWAIVLKRKKPEVYERIGRQDI